jgi:S1-C subfamily serine protease
MNMKLKNVLAIVAISAATAILSVAGYGKWMESRYAGTQQPGKVPVNYAGFFGNNAPATAVDFTAAATAATPAVVHIKTKTKARQVSNNQQRQQNPFGDMFGGDMFDQFFNGPRMQIIPEQQASGSGVIISGDGYIVTNNHVVDGADEINVTLTNKKSYKATVVGTDPSSDLAVIRQQRRCETWSVGIGHRLSVEPGCDCFCRYCKCKSKKHQHQQPPKQDPY